MFYSINGTLILCEPQTAVVEAGGVGYRLTVSDRSFGALQGKLDTKVFLYTHLSVRDDGVELFGFVTKEELELFRQLISVSGIGPKMAVSILGTLSPEALASAVLAQDAKSISAAPGVGLKTAQRIILELKDKLAKNIFVSAASGTDAAAVPASGALSEVSEAVNALTVLGYARQQALDAVKGLDTRSKSVETLIREALKSLNTK